MRLDELFSSDTKTKGAIANVATYTGEFAETPANANAKVLVIATQSGLSHTFGPCRWSPRIGPVSGCIMPVEGDECLIAIDDDGEPWVIQWWGSDNQ